MDDVIIVGGGHAGLYTADRLAKAGFRIRLFEQKPAVDGSVVCTGIIGIEAFRRFNLPQEVVVGNLHKVRFISPLGTVLDYAPESELAWIVDRGRFNEYLLRRAVEKGVQVMTQVKVESLRVRKDGVTVKTLDSSGAESSWDAKMIVLATGIHFKLFHSLGLRPAKKFLGGAQVQIPYQEDDWTQIHVGREIAPGAFAWIVPLQNGMARIGLLTEKDALPYMRKFLDRVRPGWRDDFPESRIELRPVVQGPSDRSFSDRVLVVGEAAGQIKTTTGGGIYYGLLGADLAVETVMHAFHRNQFKASTLSGYEQKWKKLISDELHFGYYFRKLCSKFSDEQIDELFARIKEEDVLSMIHREAEFDWHKSLIFSIFKIPTVKHILQEPF